jgi:hypothetical protein
MLTLLVHFFARSCSRSGGRWLGSIHTFFPSRFTREWDGNVGYFMRTRIVVKQTFTYFPES